MRDREKTLIDYSWKTLRGHAGKVYSVAVTPDGRYLVSGSFDHTIKVWQLPRPCPADVR
nr:WD40 repeat domain-containing protein [Candidatus Sigynarchaeum springense]